jgi:DNA (cytosine-5)-methyltransferase 1
MKMMTVPDSFKWTDYDVNHLNSLAQEEKIAFLKKHEINIRQSLGEAVPTAIFRSIAMNFNQAMSKNHLSDSDVRTEIQNEDLAKPEVLTLYLRKNPRNLGFASLSRIVELANANRHEQEAFFTDKRLVTEIVKSLPSFSGDNISILEPSVGAGNFLPLLFLVLHGKKINLTVCDIDENALSHLRELIRHVKKPKDIKVTYRIGDFLQQHEESAFDLVIGNPPFSKSASKVDLNDYRFRSGNGKAKNTAAFFLEKALGIGRVVVMVMPKSFLNTPEFENTRAKVEKSRIDAVIDFGEHGFGGVLVETIALFLTPGAKPGKTTVISIPERKTTNRAQAYITDKVFPYWIIYRDSDFDTICLRLKFGVFNVFRDRQITTKLLDTSGEIRVIKSRNIPDKGGEITSLHNYDSYISNDKASKLAVYKFLDNDKVYLTPNMTYKPRVIVKPKGTIVNGSAAVLILKDGESRLTKSQLEYFSSEEYRRFYRIARNKQTRSLNVDSNSVFFFGKLVM